MAGSPRFKVYAQGRTYVAACMYAEDAAAVAYLHGPGSQVRAGHRKTVFTVTEGSSGSYDEAATMIYDELAS